MDELTPPGTWPEFIAHRRGELGLTQEALAAKMHIRQSAVSRWERGEYLPPAKVIGRLVRALQITPEELHALSTGEHPEAVAS